MSLRARLALFIAVATAAALLVQGVGGYFVFRRSAYAGLDRDVALVLERVEREVLRTVGPRGLPRRSVPLAALPDDYVARARVIFRGEVVAQQEGFPEGVPLEPQRGFRTYGVWRVGGTAVAPRAPGLTVQAAVSSREVVAGLRRYRRTLVLTGVGVSLLGALVALAASRPALRPLQHLLATTRRVAASGDLSLRVPAGGGGELGEMSATFNHMLGRLAAFRERESAFTRSASHELRTPLAAMKLQLGARREGYASAEETLVAIEGEVDRMTRLTEALLALAREGRARHAPLDLAAVARAAAEVAGAPYAGPDALELTGDPLLLRRAVDNLLENSARHAPGADVALALGVRSRDGGEFAVVSVADAGPGLAEEARARATEAFYRAPGTTAAGSGLGLAVAAQVARAHGGRLELHANRPTGLRAELWLGGVRPAGRAGS